MAKCRSSEDVIGSGDGVVWEDVVGDMWVALYGKMLPGRCGRRSFVRRCARCARWMFIVKEVWGRCKSIREFIHLYYADARIVWVCACVFFSTYNALYRRFNLRQPCRCFDVFVLYWVISVGFYL